MSISYGRSIYEEVFLLITTFFITFNLKAENIDFPKNNDPVKVEQTIHHISYML